MKRSERLVGLTNFFLDHPQQLIQLSFFVNDMKHRNHRLAKI